MVADQPAVELGEIPRTFGVVGGKPRRKPRDTGILVLHITPPGDRAFDDRLDLSEGQPPEELRIKI